MKSLDAVTATGPGTVLASQTILNATVEITTTGSPASFSVSLQGSLDLVNWFNLGSAITSTGLSTFLSVVVPYLRLNLTALSGGTAPTVTGWIAATDRPVTAGGGPTPPAPPAQAQTVFDLLITTSINPVKVGLFEYNGGSTGTYFVTTTVPFNSVGSVADFDSDGVLDLLANGPPTVNVLLGNSNGSFGNATFAVGGASSGGFSIVADLNGDGKPDIASLLLDAYSHIYGVSTTLGNGDGTFQQYQTFATGTFGAGSEGIINAIAVADLNGDGKADVVVTSTFKKVAVFLGNGNGTLQANSKYNLLGFSSGNNNANLFLTDLNGDNRPEIVVQVTNGTITPGNHSVINVLLGNGNGTFQAAQTYSVPDPGSQGLAVVDVNGDGKPDLVITNGNTSGYSSMGLLLGNGNGTFQACTTFACTGRPTAVLAGDINGDGKVDLVVNTLTNGLAVFLGNGNATFGAQITSALDVHREGFPMLFIRCPKLTVQESKDSVIHGQTVGLTVTAYTNNSQVNVNYTGTVHFSTVSSIGAVFPADSTLTAGVGVFSATLTTAGWCQITATDTVLPHLQGFTNQIEVTAATHIVVTAPGTVVAGVGLVFTAAAEDEFNNVDTGFFDSVGFTSGDGGATLPGATAMNYGAVTLTATLATAGSQVISATDGGNSALTGHSAAITVTAAPTWDNLGSQKWDNWTQAWGT